MGESVHSEFYIPSKPYTFSTAFSNRFWTFNRRSSSRFSSNRENPVADLAAAVDSEHSTENPVADLAAAADSEHSEEDPTTDLATDAIKIKDSLFRPHPPFSQPSKEDYEQNFAATCAQLSSIFERVS